MEIETVMKYNKRKMGLGMAAVVLAVVSLAGCSEPAPTPLDQRKPGQDISTQDRADKRGDVPNPGKSSSGSDAGAPAPTGK
jgi:hypothetical protein